MERTSATEGYMSDGEKRWAAILPDRHDVSFVWAVCREDSKRLDVALQYYTGDSFDTVYA